MEVLNVIFKRHKRTKVRYSNPTSIRDVFIGNKSVKEKIVSALDLILKKLLHLLSESKISSNWLEKRAKEIIEENEIGGYLKKEGVYLDIGCGKGHLMYELEKENFKKSVQFFGVDIFDYPIRIIKDRIAIMRGTKAQTFAFASAEKLPFEDELFDGVTMFYLLHHLDLWLQKKALKEAKRVIGNDSDQYIFVLEEVCDSKNQERISKKNDMLLNPELIKSPHNYRSDADLVNLFKQVELEIVKAHYYLTGSKNKPLQNAFYVLKKI